MEKSVGAIVFSPDIKFLLLKYREGHVDFVKGHVEPGEFDENTLRRELFEETGIKDYGIINGFKHRITYSYPRGGNTVKKEVTLYLISTGKKKVTLSYEHTAFFWLGYEDALSKLTYSNAQDALKKARSFIRSRMP